MIGASLTVNVYKDAGDWSTVTVPIPNTGGATADAIYVPYSSFTTGAGSGAGNFSNVGAIQMTIQGNAAINGQVGPITTGGPTQYAENFANYQPASVGTFAFWDMNSDGVKDAEHSGRQRRRAAHSERQRDRFDHDQCPGRLLVHRLGPGQLQREVRPGQRLDLHHPGRRQRSDHQQQRQRPTGASPGFTLTSGKSTRPSMPACSRWI